MEIVDHRLVGALRVDLFDHDAAGAVADGDAVFQTATIEALLDGAYDGDLSVGELLEHGDLGIGTLDGLDGELVVIDGAAFVARVDGSLHSVAGKVRTPFAVVCRFRPSITATLGACVSFDALTEAVRGLAPDAPVLAVRLDGTFERLVVRSVARQHPPYPPLRDVVAHQAEHHLTDVRGTLVGFCFPDRTGGLEVPGWHLHAVDDARTVGGHVMDVALATGARVAIEATGDLHVEVPSQLGAVAVVADHTDQVDRADQDGRVADRRSEIDAVEGRATPPRR